MARPLQNFNSLYHERTSVLRDRIIVYSHYYERTPLLRDRIIQWSLYTGIIATPTSKSTSEAGATSGRFLAGVSHRIRIQGPSLHGGVRRRRRSRGLVSRLEFSAESGVVHPARAWVLIPCLFRLHRRRSIHATIKSKVPVSGLIFAYMCSCDHSLSTLHMMHVPPIQG